MAIRIVRLGSARARGEGLRIGTVRRPPRGVPKSQYSARNWYDVWLPILAPSATLLESGQQATTPAKWTAFVRRYRAEMAAPGPGHVLDLLSKLSRQTDFSVGCYCEDEARCHRSILKALLVERDAKVARSR